MKQICVVGVGYVGLVSGACFADLGNRVIALDIDEKRVENLNKGILPIYEPGLEELVERNVKAGRLSFTTSYEEALNGSEFAFIAVGTPSGVDGDADLQYVAAAARSIAENMKDELVLINKSTVPVGTGDWVADIVKEAQPEPIDFSVVSCPEFLREGSAIGDFMNPHRTVLGSQSVEAAEKVAHLHLPLRAPIVITNLRTAEMIKYASNAFLATKISFINEVADICEALGADVKEVAVGMGYDKRIGPMFLDAGLGWGGSCFPKDVKALAFMAEEKGLDPKILNKTLDVNYQRRDMVVEHVIEMLGGDVKGKTIGLLGLAFKPNTDDMRDAPSIDIANALTAAGATVRGYDPVSMDVARDLLPAVKMCNNSYEVAEGADALIVITEWNEFKQLSLKKLKEMMNDSAVIFDGRNIYDPAYVRELGFNYRAMGRGYNGHGI
ncbi:MAG: UDP-glucose/GDP-mannose dehydrogenase family protein [Anaerolineae bacterium]|jgi:UDPglucose 6-dehydrogenase|nr:UDP-glucose/GDP-mannose dehydrogenase family protein [Anaerolineae bacterium]MBT7069714.1 UDP-glucose/GDP-mannose dehydrogenase family protein [Anaerolineae bacterium]MBT7326728.1 UDP-glucose/GDP-mannose dehydrogenase family protein [Anaerolineae bacterium]